MKALLVAGGTVDDAFTVQYYKKNHFDLLIGIDGGARFFYESGIAPDLLVGDFDSLPLEILQYYEERGTEILRFCPQKDETDTQLALCMAIDRNCKEIFILGATGTRIDHVIGNIQILAQARKKGANAWLIDACNRIHLVKSQESIRKNEQFGTYVSFFPWTTTVEGLTLTGFAYPLENAVIDSESSLTVSNEITEETAHISYQKGLLLMIESKDIST